MRTVLQIQFSIPQIEMVWYMDGQSEQDSQKNVKSHHIPMEYFLVELWQSYQLSFPCLFMQDKSSSNGKSKCCLVEMETVSSDDGTSYTCKLCGEPCDPDKSSNDDNKAKFMKAIKCITHCWDIEKKGDCPQCAERITKITTACSKCVELQRRLEIAKEALEMCDTAFSSILRDKEYFDFNEEDFRFSLKCIMFLVQNTKEETQEALSQLSDG